MQVTETFALWGELEAVCLKKQRNKKLLTRFAFIESTVQRKRREA